MQKLTALIAIWLSTGALTAQMTPDQRVQDFQNLAALYAKRYAPYEWKRDALGFDLLDTSSWLDRVRGAKDDLDFYEIALEYVSDLQDTNSSYRVPSNFIADLGFTVDIYDGTVMIDSINRARNPMSDFPFQVGDELVSVDGTTSEEWIAALSRFRKWGSPLTTRRNAADLITFRTQSTVPRAVELGDTAAVVVRRANSELETYTVPWTKTGSPLTKIGPVPSPKYSIRPSTQADDTPDYMSLLREMRNWSMPAGEPLMMGQTTSEETGETLPRRYTTGIGSRTPVFRAEIAGVKVLADTVLDGHSFAPQVYGRKGQPRESIFIELVCSGAELEAQ